MTPTDAGSREAVLAPVVRWTAYRRWRTLAAIREGAVTRDEVQRAHSISAEELDAWEGGYARRGVDALKATMSGGRRLSSGASPRWISRLPVLRLTLAEFRALLDYSVSLPTGTTPGKMWRRLDGAFDEDFIRHGGRPRWVVGQYDPNGALTAGRIRVLWYRPVLTVRAAS